MIQIKTNEIEEETGICPYCGAQIILDPTPECCGEVHGEKAYLLTNGELVSVSEVEVIE